MIWNTITAAVAACFWLCAAMCVAFPQHATDFDFAKLAHEFVSGREVYTLPILLGVDLAIDSGFMLDAVRRLNGRIARVCVQGLFVSIISYIVIATFVTLQPQTTSKYAALTTAIGLLALAYPRFLSYLSFEEVVERRP